MLPEKLPLKRVTLLATHRRDIKRIVRSVESFDGLLRPAANA
jgi:hypothetical protein